MFYIITCLFLTNYDNLAKEIYNSFNILGKTITKFKQKSKLPYLDLRCG